MAPDALEPVPGGRGMSRDWPGLSQLAGAYFHQDWSLDHESWEAAVDAFSADEPASVREAARAEIVRLIESGAPDAELEHVFTGLDLNISPESRGLTHRLWLRQVLERLR
jgi:hypothetical protein